MSRHAVRTLCLLQLLTVSVTCRLASAQILDFDEVVNAEAYGASTVSGKTFACPSNVPVGERAVRLNGSLTTDNPNGISYQVLIRYGSGGDPAGMMEHRDLTTSIGTWSVGSSEGETTLELNVTVTPAQPLAWAAELWGIDPGNVYHIWQTRQNGTLTRDESCEYLIVGVPDLAISIDRSGPYWVEGSAGKSGASAGPDPGFFRAPGGVEIEANILVVNNGDLADTYGIAGSLGPIMTGVDQLFEIITVEPSEEAALECVVTGNDDSFGCDGINLPSGDEIEVVVRYHTVERGIGAISVGGAADGEQNFGDNNDFAEIFSVGDGGILYLKRVRTGRPDGGLGDDQFGPGDGFTIQLYDDDNRLVGTGKTGPIDINEDGIIDHLGAIFFGVGEGTYRAKEIVGPGIIPVDPISGEITGIVVPPGDTVVVVQKNEGPRDWGDLPDPYPRAGATCPNQCFPTNFPNGASHGVSDHVFLGDQIDDDLAPSPTAGAYGDDVLDNSDDEDGLVSFSVSSTGTGRMVIRSTLSGTIPGPFELVAWIDFDDDGILERSERVGYTVLPAGAAGVITSEFEFPVPPNSWTRYARIRLGFQKPDPPLSQPADVHDVKADGHWAIGEVEDYYTAQLGIDYGDAPEMEDSSREDVPFGYPTTLRREGAFHITNQEGFFGAPADRTDTRIGATVDGEPQAQPSTEADGDDNGNLYDEDGIRFGAGFVPVRAFSEPRDRLGVRSTYGLTPGANATFVPLANREGKMDAWIDFNRDGDWDDPGEQIADSITVSGGPNYTPITFKVPDTADLGWTFGRFRFSLTGGLDFGGGADTGEVEDYLLRIIPAFRVTTLADAGPGSFRQQIEDANATDGTDPQYIVYDEAVAGKTSAVINLQSPLPTITNPITISGGGSLVLDGSGAGDNASGLVFGGGSAGVFGVTFQGFSSHGVNLASAENIVVDNVIRNNGRDGIHIGLFEGNRVLANQISGNGAMGIDIGGDGPSANDDGDVDGIPNRPEITSVVRGSTVISVILSAAPNSDYIIQFFSSESCDESGSGEGAEFLIGTDVTTDAGGIVAIDLVFEDTLPKGRVITATATGGTGTSEFSECEVVVKTEDGVEEVPQSLRLDGNYPNPFSDLTTIPIDVPRPGDVRLEIFNPMGQVVGVPLSGTLAAGRHRVTVSAAKWPSGVYYYRLTTEGAAQTRKMIVVR